EEKLIEYSNLRKAVRAFHKHMQKAAITGTCGEDGRHDVVVYMTVKSDFLEFGTVLNDPLCELELHFAGEVKALETGAVRQRLPDNMPLRVITPHLELTKRLAIAVDDRQQERVVLRFGENGGTFQSLE